VSSFVRRDLRVAALPWLLGRVLVVGALAFSRDIYDKVGAPPRPAALGQGLFAWDAAFYRDIAEHGYRAVGEASLRFFPLVPMLARGVGWVLFGHTAAALLVVANGSALVFGALLHRLALRETGDAGVARRAAWFAALFPAAAVLVLGYAEATAMMLGVIVFLGLRSRRFGWAIVGGFLAGLCRPVGVLLVIPAAIEAGRGWRTASARSRIERIGAVVAPVAGAVAYLAWVGAEFGDFWKPISLQNRATLRGGFQDPFSRTVDAVGDLFGGDRFGSGLHVVWAAIFVVLLVLMVRRLPSSYTWYAAATLVLGLSAKNLDSFERYCMSTFPFVLALALVTDREEVEWSAYVLAAAGLVGYATLAFLGISGP
jgi:Gpi18-like mannosyltransferase